MKGLCSIGMLLGRICISAIFILAAIGKIMDYEGTSQYMASKGLTMIPIFLYGAAIVELIGGLMVLIGFKTRIGAVILLLFLIPTTLIFHDFWNVSEALARQLQMIIFMKNLAIFGGLLYIVCAGPGRIACCSRCCNENPKL
jgi:putative oxidoreductase